MMLGNLSRSFLETGLHVVELAEKQLTIIQERFARSILDYFRYTEI